MAIDLSVFGPLTKNWITGNMQCSLIVTNKCYLLILPKLKFLKKLFKPNKFSCGGCHSALLCFNIWPSNHILLLMLPGKKIASNKYTIARSGMSIIWRSYPISIRVPDYLGMPFILINKAFSRCSFDTLQNVNNRIPMTFTWWV